jgi:hypothetical protein
MWLSSYLVDILLVSPTSLITAFETNICSECMDCT